MKLNFTLAIFLVGIFTLIACGGGGSSVTGGGNGGNNGGNNGGGNNGGNGGINATYTGRVEVDGLGIGVANVRVQFLNSAGVQVAQAIADSNGDFTAIVSPQATRLHLVSGSFSTTAYFTTYLFNGFSYASNISSCSAPFTGVAAGQAATLPTLRLLLRTGAPPPPPTCQ